MKSALKKLTSLALAVLMAALLVPSAAVAQTVGIAASDKASITIENAKVDKTYSVYKLFSATVAADSNDDGKSDSIAYTGDIPEALDSYFVKDSAGNISAVSNSLSPDAIAAIKAYAVANLTPVQPKVKCETTPLIFEGLEYGYYVVTTDSGAVITVDSTNPKAVIKDKNEIPFDKTDNVGDTDGVEVGQEVKYTIEGQVPNTSAYNTFDYVITDKMTEGLTFNESSIKIYISEDDVLTEADSELGDSYYTKITTGAKSFNGNEDVAFRVNFKPVEMNTAGMAGEYIFITYSATVNDNAVAKTDNNHATLSYSNDPSDSTQHGTLTDEEKVYSAKIVVNKHETGNTGKTLAYATFVLKNSNNLYYKYTAASGGNPAKVEWVSLENATSKTTQRDGKVEFPGLKDGTYTLEETQAPNGYNKLDQGVEVTINGDSAVTSSDLTPLTKTENVANDTGALLPSTGGIGTTIFYVGGGILIVGALAAFIIKRRSAKHTA